MHKIIEEYTRKAGSVKIQDIADAVLNGQIAIDNGPPDLDLEHRRKLWKHLDNFLKFNNKIGFDGEVEWKFEFDLDPPHQRLALGFIDRLIHKNDKVFIIDYKTTKASPWRKNETTILADLQLQCYCYIVMTRFQVPAHQIRAALYFTEDGKLLPVTFAEKTLLAVPKRLLNTYRNIETTDPDQVIGNTGKHCRFCDWRRQCPFYRIT